MTPSAQPPPNVREAVPATTRGAPVDGILTWAALCLLALVLLYRPVSSALGYGLAEGAAFGLVLLAAGTCWLAGELLGAPRGRLRLRFGLPGLLFVALLGAALASSLRAENWFAGLRWCLNLATYGLTAFLVLQMAGSKRARAFLVSSLLATGVALAAYALWHALICMPALRRWMELEPTVFGAFVRAEGPLFQDLAARVTSPRAYGNFITPNQLAGFLALVFFPLASLLAGRRQSGRHAAGRSSPRLSRVALGAALLLSAVAILLSRSKGAWIAFCFGAFVFGLLLAGGAVRRHARKLLIGLALLAALLVAAHVGGLVPGPQRFARSLGVRVHYWETSAWIALQRPLLGVGPGSWPEWYTMLKQPEYEETQAAHSVYLELWAEGGTVGLLLFTALWVAVFALALKDRPPAVTDTDQQVDEAERRRPMLVAGLCVGLLAFAFDYALLGTFAPPEHVPGWLASARWLPYLVVYACWAAAFAAAFTCVDGADAALLARGIAAGLAAFLLHSAGEFTLRVPAIGGSAAALAALLLVGRDRPRPRELHPGPALSVLVAAACGAMLVFWFAFVTPRALDHALSKREAESEEPRLKEGSAAQTGAEAVALAQRITADYSRACTAVPYDDEAWREYGAWLSWLGQSGLAEVSPLAPVDAFRRAVGLNPLHSGNWARLGAARSFAGAPAGAVEAYRRAAELFPSLPLAWYKYARAIEATGRTDAEAADAYRRALSLLPRQYQGRNRVLGPAGELADFWSRTTGQPVPESFIDLAVQIASRASDVAMPGGADARDKVAALTAGLEGADRLLEQWNGYDEQMRARQLWGILAPRLWEWALGQKVGGSAAPGVSRTE